MMKDTALVEIGLFAHSRTSTEHQDSYYIESTVQVTLSNDMWRYKGDKIKHPG